MTNYFFTKEQLKTAYFKLKSYVYYDSGELLLREKIVEFETNIKGPDDLFYLSIFNNRYNKYVNKDNKKFSFGSTDITVDQKLEIITEQLNKFHENPEFYETLIKEIDITILPKKIKNEEKIGSIVSNRRIKDKYFLDKVTAFIEAPIEIHILSVLWLMIEGVKIDAKLLDECIGNRLFLNKNNENVLQGSSLFKPYFKQYQKWRDGAVNSAKELLDKDKNVLFLNLDIKDYFYSVRIDKEIFPEKKVLRPSQTYFNLGNILHKIHKNYTLLILESYKIPYDFKNEILDKDGNLNRFILPIGLLSSYILANDYLKDFDKIILEKYKPAYYGRYVDDILIVLSEPNLVNENDKHLDYFFSFEKYKEKLATKNDNFHQADFTESDLSEVENYILYNFHNIVSLVNNPFYSNSDSTSMESRIFKLNAYPSLFFQSEKTILHFFDKDESSIVIDKLKKELEEKSSEFRDMPNDNEDDTIFEDSAYYLNYDGSEGKIKTLKDYKENKFGLSVYLSHKINLALRNQNILSDKEQKKIINFFKGENVLTFYRLWEKILTLFLVNNLPHNYVDFLFHCLEQIDKISTNKKYDKEVIINLQNSLVTHLFCSHEISISLNLNFFKSSDIKRYYEFGANRQKNKNYILFTSSLDFLDPKSYQAVRYRNSNMIRHHYVVIPLLNYTKASTKKSLNLVDRKTHIESFNLDEDLLKDSPRPIKFWECCIASSFKQLNKFSKIKDLQIDNDGYLKTDILYDFEPIIIEEDIYDEVAQDFKKSEKRLEQSYLDDAFNIYLLGNTNHDNNYETNEDIKKKFYIKNVNNFVVNNENKITKPKIAFANTKIEEDNILNSILKSPNLTSERYNKLANILKKAREEHTDLLLFPECFIPINLLSTLSRYSVDNGTLIVTGLEHITLNKTSFNFVATILPVEVNGIKDATIILRLKNNYSPGEENLINKNHLIVPKPKTELAQIINWRNLYFSVCYCFEMANITQREKLKGKIDLLIGIEWNKDTPYFSNIVEASTRDLHCYVAQVNTSNFGDTRLSQPTESAVKDILKLKGGTNDLIITGEINTKKLRDFQRIKTSINDSKEFKPLPPNFDLKNVLDRINDV
ncbi:hypothetical protein L0B70_08755 [Kaistella sp. 97-N-M2]|uniref:reverse transcriptase domain-containing protein n=1 Tax=Kaistella sp. 97-N-M2 TaxID=2908645 RepID=UPI001F44F478|nr:reverse transcriptase domain-containing protein [Kaistella sp. 97-N-M2]UJF28945.1 hypothetical protein L0B70_08755 [Kaistella sp. 97-N-M2]